MALDNELKREVARLADDLAGGPERHLERDGLVDVAPDMDAPLREALRGWPFQPRLIPQSEKFAAFRQARAARLDVIVVNPCKKVSPNVTHLDYLRLDDLFFKWEAQRFFREARVAAKLSHPGIVVCHDVGKDPASGKLFIVFERLRGRTLAQRIAKHLLDVHRLDYAPICRIETVRQHHRSHNCQQQVIVAQEAESFAQLLAIVAARRCRVLDACGLNQPGHHHCRDEE